MKILICDICKEEEKKIEEARYVRILITTRDFNTKKYSYNFAFNIKKTLCPKHLVLLQLHVKNFLENEGLI
jgi:hypothetical protein